MIKLTRRRFILSAAAAAGARILPQIAARSGGRRILTLVNDKGAGDDAGGGPGCAIGVGQDPPYRAGA